MTGTSPRRTLQAVLRDVGARLALDLEPDHDGAITLALVADVTCTLEAPEDGAFVFLHAEVSPLPAGDARADALEWILARNCFALSLPNAWLAIDRSDMILLCAAEPAAGLDADRLSDLLLNAADAIGNLRVGLFAKPQVSITSREELDILRP